jgi:hypothetical protein
MHTAIDEFVPDSKVRAELGISDVTMWRWDRDPQKAALGWPPPMRTGTAKYTRKFRSRRLLEQFKANVLQRAIHGGEAA